MTMNNIGSNNISGTGSLDTFEALLNKLKNDKVELSMCVLNVRFFAMMLGTKNGITSKIYYGPMGIAFNYQLWNDVPIVFSPFIEDWYIIPKCKWYEQKLEGSNSIEPDTIEA